MKKINIDNIEKLQTALDEVQARCTARTVTANNIAYILHEIDMSIPKTRLNGTKVHWDGAEKFPHAYKHTPESTHWWAENVNGRWYVTDIRRAACPNRVSRKGTIEYSEAAKAYIIEQNSMLF